MPFLAGELAGAGWPTAVRGGDGGGEEPPKVAEVRERRESLSLESQKKKKNRKVNKK